MPKSAFISSGRLMRKCLALPCVVGGGNFKQPRNNVANMSYQNPVKYKIPFLIGCKTCSIVEDTLREVYYCLLSNLRKEH